MVTLVHSHSLASRILPQTHPALQAVVLAVAGTLLLTLSAKIQVPFWPVPLTMQTCVVFIIAMVYGSKLGLATILLYLMEGAIGLPVFAGTPEKGIGLAYMAGPTGGYLVGFVVATMLLGFFNSKSWDKSFVSSVLAMTCATVVVYSCGFVWLAYLIGADKAWQFGVVPFVLGDLLKIVLAASLLPLLWKLIARQS